MCLALSIKHWLRKCPIARPFGYISSIRCVIHPEVVYDSLCMKYQKSNPWDQGTSPVDLPLRQTDSGFLHFVCFPGSNCPKTMFLSPLFFLSPSPGSILPAHWLVPCNLYSYKLYSSSDTESKKTASFRHNTSGTHMNSQRLLHHLEPTQVQARGS